MAARTISGAAKKGRLELLRALQANIARQLDEGVAPRELASLSIRLMDINKELEELTRVQEGDGIGQAAQTPAEPWPAT